MSRAHTLLRRGAWGRANLADLAAEVLSPFRARSGSNVVTEGLPVWIVPELTQSLALILHELATNAVKHGALSSPTGRVKVSWSRIEGSLPGQLRLVWREEGGPAVRQPTAKGFGLTVLQEAAGDLGGVAACDFQAEGLVYTLQGPFEMPAKRAGARLRRGRREGVEQEEAASPPQRPRPPHSRGRGRGAGRAAAAGGPGERRPSRGRAGALAWSRASRLPINEDIDAALVDVSLGRETSAPIADQLLARNIPFAFATGYADGSMLPEHLRAMPRLSKPYALAEVRRLVQSLVAKGKPPLGACPPT